MDITKDIQPMTTFRNHSAEIMQHLKDTKRPVILTVNGKAAAVVQDAEAYQHLLDLAAEASAAEGIRQGLEDLRTGRTRPARVVKSGEKERSTSTPSNQYWALNRAAAEMRGGRVIGQSCRCTHQRNATLNGMSGHVTFKTLFFIHGFRY